MHPKQFYSPAMKRVQLELSDVQYSQIEKIGLVQSGKNPVEYIKLLISQDIAKEEQTGTLF